MNLAVVLISDQTIPNVVYLKEIREKWDKVLFITTEGMEKKQKSETIAKALDNCPFDKIVVDENMIFDVTQKLENYFSENNYDKAFVNITGGTKIMSLGTYMFFKDKSFVENIVYLPIGKTTYKQLYPMGKDGKAKDIPLSYRMSIEEYIEALGLKIEQRGNIVNKELTLKIFDVFSDKYWIFNEITQILREYRTSDGPKKLSKSEDIEKVKSFLEVLGFDSNRFDFKSNRKWIDYFSGGWFEEYIYLKISDLKGKCFDDVVFNFKLKPKNEEVEKDNEFDLIFIRDNKLGIIECKTGNMENRDITNVFYKVAYLNRTFGLSAESYISFLSKNIFDKEGNLKNNIKENSKVFNVKVITESDIGNMGEFFKCK